MSDGMEFIDLDTDDARVIGVKVTGRFTREGMTKFVARVEEVTAAGNKALVYVDLAKFDGSEMAVAKEKLSHFSTLWHGIERMAYIVDSGWMSKMIRLVDAVTPMHIRPFGHDQADEARAWLLSNE